MNSPVDGTNPREVLSSLDGDQYLFLETMAGAAGAVGGGTGRNLQSALRVLVLAKTLVSRGAVSLVHLQQLLDQDIAINRSLSFETIAHHLAILRAAGWPIETKVGADGAWLYHLQQGAFTFGRVSEHEATSWAVLDRILERRQLERLLLGLLVCHDDPAAAELALSALQHLRWGLPSVMVQPLVTHSDGLASLNVANDTHLGERSEAPLTSGFRWEAFHGWCKSGQVITISLDLDRVQTPVLMLHPSGADSAQANNITMLPVRREWHQCQWYLLGVDVATRQNCMVAVQAIHCIQTTPQKVPTVIPLTAVTFRLKGRLAKTYRPYPEEKILSQSDDETTVRALTDNPWGLMPRLLRYVEQCQILSPDSLRQEMERHVAGLLEALCLPNPRALAHHK